MEDVKTHKGMLAELRDSGCNVNLGGITHIETINLYDLLVANKSMTQFEDNVNLVKFPIHKPDQYDTVFELVKYIDLNHRSSFISANTIDMDTGIDIIDFLSTYIYFDKHKYINYEYDTFMAVPSNIVNFAYNSRIDSGFYLLERCLRHSFASKTDDLRKATIKLFVNGLVVG